MWLCDDIERWDTNDNAFSPSTFITTPSHHPHCLCWQNTKYGWAHHIVSVYWKHKHFSVTNSMINLQFVPSLGLDIVTKMEIGILLFVNAPHFFHFIYIPIIIIYDSVRWDELQRFQLCPYYFCYHHSCCFVATYSQNHKWYTDCNFKDCTRNFLVVPFLIFHLFIHFLHIHLRKRIKDPTRLAWLGPGVWCQLAKPKRFLNSLSFYLWQKILRAHLRTDILFFGNFYFFKETFIYPLYLSFLMLI